MAIVPPDSPRQRAVPLVVLPPGSRARVLTVTGRGHGVRMRLLQMGLTPGAIVEIVENYGRGPVLVRVRGAVLALGRGLAEKVLVEPV